MKKILFILTAVILSTIGIQGTTMAQAPCTALFNHITGTPTGQGVPVSFFDSSFYSGSIVAWNWVSSDGQISSAQNPTFIYSINGTYQVCLSITAVYMNQPCTSTYCDSITIGVTPPACNATFTYTINPQVAVFIASAGNNVSWNWSFGDGSAGTGANATHIYNSPGTYTVCLTVVDASGVTCTSCQSVTAPSTAGCQAYYTSSQILGTTIWNFTNQSQGNAPYFYWNFGDGSYSIVQNPSHTFSANGTYLVCLTIVDSIAGCTDTYCDSIVVGGGILCNATFGYQTAPGATVFNANLQNVGATYVWDFGDSTSGTSSIITHVYTPGTYVACLTVTTSNGTTCTSCQTITVQGSAGCSSNFAIYPDTTQLHAYIAYNLATGTGAISYIWSWGDGTSSNTAYPSHTYASAGTYTICLTITDASGCTSNTCYQFALLRLSGVSSPVTINVVAGTTGIAENNLLNSLTVSPNPANDYVNANFNIIHDTDVQYTVTSITGQQVFASPSTKYAAGSHSIRLNVSEFTSGMYVLEITAGGKRNYSKILVQ